MGSSGEKADQLRLWSTRLDHLRSPSQTKASKNPTYEEKDVEDSDFEEAISRMDRKIATSHDGNLESIKMKILAFQERNDPEIYLE